MKAYIIIIAVLSTSLASMAHASTSSSKRGAGGAQIGMAVGGWKAAYTQEGAGLKTSINSDTSFGLQFFVGGRIGLVFFEYTPQLYLSSLSSDPYHYNAKANDMNHFSVAAGNVGLVFPLGGIDLRPYVGGGWGTTGFNTGSSVDYTGLFARAGVILGFTGDTLLLFGLKAEYQRSFLHVDEGGEVPSPYSTRADLVFVGLVFGMAN
jgi:hypothetical protein